MAAKRFSIESRRGMCGQLTTRRLSKHRLAIDPPTSHALNRYNSATVAESRWQQFEILTGMLSSFSSFV